MRQTPKKDGQNGLRPMIRVGLKNWSNLFGNTGFDELPQLLNILQRRMSFIGQGRASAIVEQA